MSCNKKTFKNKWLAKLELKKILRNSGKLPYRDEISVYECDKCGKYHLSSLAGNGSYTTNNLQEKDYFEIQKEKWNKFLLNYSDKKARINYNGKKYGT